MIKLNKVNKVFGKGASAFYALKNIDLNIEKGEMVAVVGKSGSGKSTLLNIIGGIDKCTDGTYFFNHDEVSNFGADKLAEFRCNRIGFVVQHFALINDMTVSENVALPLRYCGKSGTAISETVINMLEKLELIDKAKAYPAELSGGQCQRVAIARALVADSELILADEPTGALDEETGERIVEILEQLNDSGKTVVIVTHDEDIAKSCKRVIKLKDGRIESDRSLTL